MSANAYVGSDAADAASTYYNSLPFEEKQKLAPLLDHYRQMGLAEALGHVDLVAGRIKTRIRGIRDAD